jgi:hypothetical protein
VISNKAKTQTCPATAPPKEARSSSTIYLPPAPERDLTAEARSLIRESLGQSLLDFIGEQVSDTNYSANPESTALAYLAKKAKIVEHQDLAKSVLEALTFIEDFAERLKLPRQIETSGNWNSNTEVTIPQGDSVQLLHLALKNLEQQLHQDAGKFSDIQASYRDECLSRELTNLQIPKETASIDAAALPNSDDDRQNRGREQNKRGAISWLKNFELKLRFGKLKIPEWVVSNLSLLLAATTAAIQGIVHKSKALARPGSNPSHPLWKILGSISELNLVDLQFIGGSLQSAANAALGLLGPRGSTSRYSQTGKPENDQVESTENSSTNSSAGRKALLRFIIELPQIRSFIARQKNVDGQTSWFYAKEAFVVTNTSGRLERLDVFINKSPELKELATQLTKERFVDSSPADPNSRWDFGRVTIPVIPLMTTSLPISVGSRIFKLEYLNAKGQRIEQPENNSINENAFGITLITPPINARIVRYATKKIEDISDALEATPEARVALTKALSGVGLNLGEASHCFYEKLRQIPDSGLRLAIAHKYELERRWVYTMKSSVTEIQRAAGDAFLEAVYHTRAGICDSLSAVSSQLIGSQIGLPGVVLDGPCQEDGIFDTRVGHAISATLLNNRLAKWDLASDAHKDQGVSAHRIPRAARLAFTEALQAGEISRRELVEIYENYGEIIRGNTPSWFHSHGAIAHQEVSKTWLRLVGDFGSSTESKARNSFNHDNSLKNLDLTYRLVEYSARATEFDAILSRCRTRKDYSELLWNLERDLPFQPKADELDHFHPRLQEQAKRDLQEEFADAILEGLELDLIPYDNLQRLFPQIQELDFHDRVNIALQLSETHPEHPVYSQIVEIILNGATNHQRASSNELLEILITLVGRCPEMPVKSQKDTVNFPHYFQKVLEAKHLGQASNEPEVSLQLKIQLLTAMRKKFDAFFPEYFCEEFENLSEINNLFKSQPDSTREILGLNNSNSKARFAEAFAKELYKPQKIGTILDLNSLSACLLSLMPDFSLENTSVSAETGVLQVLKFYINWKTKGKTLLANLPKDEFPASQLLIEADPFHVGAVGINFLYRMVKLNALPLDTAEAVWPVQDEKRLAEYFESAVRYTPHGIGLTRNSSAGEFTWRASSISEALKVIVKDTRFANLAEWIDSTTKWLQQSNGHNPQGDHNRKFLETFKILGRIPGDLALRSSNESAFARTLIGLARENLSDAAVYEAVQEVAPYLITPKEPEKFATFLKDLSALREQLQQDKDTEVAEIFLRYNPYTKQRPYPRSFQSSRQCLTAACLIAEAQLLTRVDSRYLLSIHHNLFRTDIADLGTQPNSQIWQAHFVDNSLITGYPSHERLEVLSLALDCLFKTFGNQSSLQRLKMRSYTQSWILQEKGRLHVNSSSGHTIDNRRFTNGDSRRDINWKASARRESDQLIVKVRGEIEERHLSIVADLAYIGKEIEALLDFNNSQGRTNKGKYSRGKRRPFEIADVLRLSPALSTLVHETYIAEQLKLKVDLQGVYHAPIKQWKNCGEMFTRQTAKSTNETLEEFNNFCMIAGLLHKTETELLGNSTLSLPQLNLEFDNFAPRPRSMVILLLDPMRCGLLQASQERALKTRGFVARSGPLPSFLQFSQGQAATTQNGY